MLAHHRSWLRSAVRVASLSWPGSENRARAAPFWKARSTSRIQLATITQILDGRRSGSLKWVCANAGAPARQHAGVPSPPIPSDSGTASGCSASRKSVAPSAGDRG